MKRLFNKLKTPFKLSLVMFVICGLIYPTLMIGLSQVIFPHQANGTAAQNVWMLWGASLLIGACSVIPQFFIPTLISG